MIADEVGLKAYTLNMVMAYLVNQQFKTFHYWFMGEGKVSEYNDVINFGTKKKYEHFDRMKKSSSGSSKLKGDCDGNNNFKIVLNARRKRKNTSLVCTLKLTLNYCEQKMILSG